MNLNPTQEILNYLAKFEAEQSQIEDRRYEIQREVDRLEREDANLVDRFNELESAIEICQRVLAGEPVLKAYLKKFECEQFAIEDRRYEIRHEIDTLEYEDADLIDRFTELEPAIEICQRALVGEPIAIWAEIHRF